MGAVAFQRHQTLPQIIHFAHEPTLVVRPPSTGMTAPVI
jgi:hypothetical protein